MGFVGTPVTAAGEPAAEPAKGEDGWHWHRPLLVARKAMPGSVDCRPRRIVWIGGKACLVWENSREGGETLVVHRENGPGQWEKVAEHQTKALDSDRPLFEFAAGGKLYAAGTSADGRRIVLEDLLDPDAQPVIACRSEGELFLVNALSEGDRIDLSFIESVPVQAGGQPPDDGVLRTSDSLKLLRSADGGRTWSDKVVAIGPVGRSAQMDGMVLYRDPVAGMGQFGFKDQSGVPPRVGRKTMLFQSMDQGLTWQPRGFGFAGEISDGNDGCKIAPLSLLRHGEDWAIYYYLDLSGTGTCHVMNSGDRGRTWDKGCPVGSPFHLEGGYGQGNWIGAALAGGRTVYWYYEELGGEFGPPGRGSRSNLLVGDFPVTTTRKIDQTKDYLAPPLFNTVSAAPDGKRFIIASLTALGRAGPDNDAPSTHYLTVQTYSADPPVAGAVKVVPAPETWTDARPAVTDAKTKERIAHLIEQLKGDAAPAAAWGQLSEFGRLAEPQLREALKSSDALTRQHAATLIEAMSSQDDADRGIVEGPPSPIR